MAINKTFQKRRLFALSSISFALAVGLSACGEGTTGGSGGGTLTFVSSFPSKDAQGVGLSVNNPITITVAEELDPTSITQAVHLMPAPLGDQDHEMSTDNEDVDMMADIISGTATVTNGTTITFQPNAPLSPGTRYHFHVAGVKLANNKTLRTGTDVIEFFFTTAHAHEKSRTYYNESGVQICTRNTAVQNNERIMRQYVGDPDGCSEASRTIRRGIQSGASLPLTTHYKRGGHTPTVTTSEGTITVERYTEWGQIGSNNIRSYEREYPGLGTVDFRADPNNPSQFIATDWWSESEMHGVHRIEYNYEAPTDAGVNPFVQAAAKTDFVLEHASLMEMNHSLTLPTQGMFPHRHIFYRSLGDNNKIDIDSRSGNPFIDDDMISSYHTREYNLSGQRSRDWTFKGNSRRQSGEIVSNGNVIKFDTNLDIATRVRVYHFDPGTKLRTARFSYQSDTGMTVADWNNILTSQSLQTNPTVVPAGVELHDFRRYNYDNEGNLTTIEVIHECDNACSGYNDFQYGLVANMFREQTRTYTKEPNVSF